MLQAEQNSSPWDAALPGSPKSIQVRKAGTARQSNTHHMQEDVMKKIISSQLSLTGMSRSHESYKKCIKPEFSKAYNIPESSKPGITACPGAKQH